jgi:hypothetical protein
MAQPFVWSQTITDASGVPVNGALIYTYEAGTFTPKAVFTTPDLSVAHDNPISCANGKVPALYLGAGAYRFRVTDAAGVELPQYARDEVTQSSGVGSDGGPVSFYTETQTATAGQTLFSIVGGSYVPGSDSLTVEIDGFDLERAADYAETSSTSVTLNSGAKVGQRVKFKIGRYTGTGIGLSSVGKGLAEDASGSSTDGGSYRFRRRATYSGGTPGFVNAALFVDTFVEATPGGASTAAAFEWAGVFVMHNRSTTSAENVALYRQGIKYPGAGPTWAGTDEIIDWQTDPTTGAIGVELSFTANGTDANSARVAYDVALRKRDGAGASPVLSWGYRIQTETGSKVVRGFSFTSGSTADVGFDTSLATINTAAFKMAQGQAIAFRAADDRKLFHDGTGLAFTNASNALLFRLNDTGIPQFGIASTAAATPGSFAANRTIRIQQLDGTVLYVPAMLSTW